jgi:hypothetical protein
MVWLVLWLLVAGIGAYLRWGFADGLVVRLLADSREAGGGPLAAESIEQLGRFVRGAGLVIIVMGVFLLVVQVRYILKSRETPPE